MKITVAERTMMTEDDGSKEEDHEDGGSKEDYKEGGSMEDDTCSYMEDDDDDGRKWWLQDDYKDGSIIEDLIQQG